jgi:hypothetical protein
MASVCEFCGSANELEALPEFEEELEGVGELEDELEGELEEELEGEGELEEEAGLEGEGWLGAIGNVVGSLLGEEEFEEELGGAGELEDELETEMEISPIRKIYTDAMMEHMGELAAESETEDEAVEHFLPLVAMAAKKLLPVAAKALAPLAKRALPKIARAVTRVEPHLTRGVGRIARGLHRRPAARHLLKAVPGIARRTVHTIARHAARGRPVTPRAAVRTLAHHTRRVLGHPQRRAHALRRHRRLEKHFHRGVGRGIIRPHWRYRWIGGRRVRVPYTLAPGRAVGAAARVRAGAPVRAGVPGRVAAPGRAARYGRIVGGRCVCPACGGAVAANGVAATPAYCRCCGQLLR